MDALHALEKESKMHNLPTRLQTLLDTVNHCLRQLDSKAFLYGDALLYQMTGNEGLLLNKEINIIISYDVDFNVNTLYQQLIQRIVINKEIERSETLYHIASMGFELKMNLVFQFDPTRLIQAKQFGRFNFDVLFYDLSTKELRHPPEVSDDISTLTNINDPEGWAFEDILGFARKIGTLSEITIDERQNEHLKNISLAMVPESLDTSWDEEIEDILLSRHPGSALRFLAETFVDGMPWIFKTLVDYMISLDVPINEESTIETVFNEKKFNLTNLYNDHFLAEKQAFETSDEIHHRLTTTLKLLFDSPNLVIPKPYVNRIRTMAGGVLGRCCLGSKVGGAIQFFGCGENIEQEDCLGLPVFCTGGDPCLKEHPAFSHIPENNWQLITVTNREWCPDQVCPEGDPPIHCLPPTSSSLSSSNSSSSNSSSNSSSSSTSNSSSSSSLSSSSLSSSSNSSSSSSSGGICKDCPDFDFAITPVLDVWNTTSSSIGTDGCKIFRFIVSQDDLDQGHMFHFTTCDSGGSGGTANFTTLLKGFEPGDCPSDFSWISTVCETTRSDLQTTTPQPSISQTGNHYIKVEEDGGGSGGTFTLAYTKGLPV